MILAEQFKGEVELAVTVMNNLQESMETVMENNRESINEFIKNKDIPLEERWALFKKLPEEFSVCTYWTGTSSFDSPYDDFYMERHETRLVSQLPSYLEREDEADIEILKEQLLQDGYTQVIYDW